MTISHSLNVKFIDIIMNLVHEQNAQLLQIIAEEEKLNYKDIMTLLPSNYSLRLMLTEFSQGRLVKSNSTSESSVSSSSPEEE